MAISFATQNTLNARTKGEAIMDVFSSVFGTSGNDLSKKLSEHLAEKDKDKNFVLGHDKASKIILISCGKWDDFDDEDYRMAIDGAATVKNVAASIFGDDGGSGFAAASNVLLMEYWIDKLPTENR